MKTKCPTGKKRYPGEIRAKYALGLAVAARSVHPDQRREIRAYLCNLCKGWHLTSQEFKEG